MIPIPLPPRFPRRLSPSPFLIASPLLFLVASRLSFLVASPRPRPLRLPPPKATTITSVAASFASTNYNQEVLFSPTIIAAHNHPI